MSLEELREQNKRLVTEKALECFIQNGISNTRISDIAAASGLTQRSVFRYFASKDDIIIAAAFCYWERAKAHIARELEKHTGAAQTGIEQIRIILQSYANMLFTDPEGIRFSLDAEVALYNAGKNAHVVNRPPERYESHMGPLSQAVLRGLADGTVDPGADVRQLYYNAYDSILGMMQRLSLGVPSVNELDAHERLRAMCEMFTQEFAAKS